MLIYRARHNPVMRLWHEDLLSALDRQRLLAQHRECCALRGKGWGRKHSTVDYVFRHPPCRLYAYHLRVMSEMTGRGYRTSQAWYLPSYRGSLPPRRIAMPSPKSWGDRIFPEHDDAYLAECLMLLRDKGAELADGTTAEERLLKMAVESPEAVAAAEIRLAARGK